MEASARSLFVDSAGLPWRPSPYAGVSWKKLRHDRATGSSAVLLRFAPGAAYGSHRHPAGEEYWVIEGSIEDGEQSYGAGAYVFHPPGSVHRPRSAAGCLLFVVLPRAIQVLEDEN